MMTKTGTLLQNFVDEYEQTRNSRPDKIDSNNRIVAPHRNRKGLKQSSQEK